LPAHNLATVLMLKGFPFCAALTCDQLLLMFWGFTVGLKSSRWILDRGLNATMWIRESSSGVLDPSENPSTGIERYK